MKIDDITYEIKYNDSTNKYYIRAGYPFNYLTDEMKLSEVKKVAFSMRQLGFTIINYKP